MSTDPTIQQGGPDRLRSQEMSLRRAPPPAAVPGYELERLLGTGAYGEVWLAVERNTGRRVAIKFYAHRGGLDWSLLSREVEKLAFLFADRYVVQLIGVGWDAEPPYYIMEYLEQGSLAERLQSGTLPVGEAVELFHDVAVGLLHAHGKGVLHCDLKPANILLDQDGKPRLADFGQSRLSHEQAPALGTLFYMAPEQSDLAAVPDARWDVYALGALLYTMLTGDPPHRTEENVRQLDLATDLEQRLALYRRIIRRSPPPTAHRQTPGVDRALAEIIDRCLAPDPRQRFPNVQAVLDALDARALRRARRPAMVLGAVGPVLLLAVVSLFAWQGFNAAVRQHEQELTERGQANNQLNALRVADIAATELQRRFDAVEQVASSAEFCKTIEETVGRPDVATILGDLSDPQWADASPDGLPEAQKKRKDFQTLRAKYGKTSAYQALQRKFRELIPAWMSPPEKEGAEGKEEVASWFFCDVHGISAARVPESKEVLGKNFAWRSFFHDGNRDMPETWRPRSDQLLKGTKLSAVFQSKANGDWIVAMAAPVVDPAQGGKFLGVIALTVRVNRFVELKASEDQFAVLADLRPGEHTGMIVQHPLFDKHRPARPRYGAPETLAYQKLLEDLQPYRLPEDESPLPGQRGRQFDRYRDPFAAAPEGGPYDRQWLASLEPVSIRGKDTGWAVIVQESYDSAIGDALARLRWNLLQYGLSATGMVLLVLVALWALALRLLRESSPLRRMARTAGAASPTDRPPSETSGTGGEEGRIVKPQA